MSLMYQDPDMAEIVDEFLEESRGLTEELIDTIEDFEDDLSNTSLLEAFGQKIDRIMGAAESIEAEKIGKYCKLGKLISYKASQINKEEQELLNITCAVMADTADILMAMYDSVEKDKDEEVKGINLEAFFKRLEWLAEKFSHIERASVAYKDNEGEDTGSSGGDKVSNDDIDDLIASLNG